MRLNLISSHGLAQTLQVALRKNQFDLATAQTEVQTGRYADLGAEVGQSMGRSVSLHIEHAQLTTISETNSIASAQLDASQAALKSIVDTATNFVSTMMAARSSATGPGVAQLTAQAAFKTVADTLNTAIGGVYVFAGINNTAKPFKANLDDTSAGAGKSLVNSFVTAFGTQPGDAANGTITSTAMNTFLDTGFDGLFSDSSWESEWSAASDQNVVSRIAPTESIATSVNINAPAFRKLMSAFSMISKLGMNSLGQGAFEAVADKAIKSAQEAIGGMADLQTELGVSQQRITAAGNRSAIQLNILSQSIDGLEAVDPYAAATRVSELQTQLETSFALTARIQKLSLLNYL